MAVGCNPGGSDSGETDDTDGSNTNDECLTTSPVPEGSQVWSVRPDGACAESPSHAWTGPFGAASWSPDGTHVRFYDSSITAYVHAPRSGDDGVLGPNGSISPDWEWVADSAYDEDEALVYTVDSAAGSDHATVTLAIGSDNQGIYWSPNSDMLVVNTENIGTSYGDGPYILTRDLQIVRSYYGVFFEGYAQWSPTGALIAVPWPKTYDNDRLGVWMLPPNGDDPYLAWEGNPGAMAWTSDGARFVVTASPYPDPTPGMWVVGAEGGEPEAIWTPEDGGMTLVGVSSTGTIALRTGPDYPTSSLTFLDLDGGNRRDVTGPTGWLGAWSPDGAWFGGQATDPVTGRSQIFVVRPDGTDLTRLTSTTDLNVSFNGWSPGSDRLLYVGPPPVR